MSLWMRCGIAALWLAAPLLQAGSLQLSVGIGASDYGPAYGAPLSLQAYLPSDATGLVEFLDGAVVLGTAPVVNGQALFVVSAPGSGLRLFQARYRGDATYAGGASSVLGITISSNPSTGLSGPTIYTTFSTAFQFGAGDFDGDGKIDLIAAGSEGVSFLHGNGDGTFADPITVAVTSAYSVAVGDFDGDGIPDLALGDTDAATISILRGNGDGTFQSVASYPAGDSPQSITVADLNGDGVGDLVVFYAQYGPYVSGVNVLLGNPDGTFQAAVSVVNGEVVNAVAVGDFDRDGTADLILFRNDNFTVELLRGNGDGTFQGETPIAALAGAYSVTTGDLNGDGNLDLVVPFSNGVNVPNSPPQSTNVDVLLGNGDGTFAAPVGYSAAGNPYGATIADFNGDGLQDVAVSGGLQYATSILPGTGNGALGTGTVYNLLAPYANYLLAEDFNGDGITDLVVGSHSPSSNVNVFLGQRPPVGTYQDVTPSDYYYTAVSDLYEYGVTNGCTSTDYCPDQLLPRWEAAVLLVRSMYGSDQFVASTDPYFADVPADAPGFTWIQKLYELGITAGCGMDGSGNLLFCPDNNLTRAEAAILIVRSRFGVTMPFTSPSTPYFTDVPTGAFGFAYIQRLREDNITSGCAATLFCPANSVTRADIAMFLDRADFNRLLPLTQPVLTNSSSQILYQGFGETYYLSAQNTHFVQGTTQLVLPANSGVSITSLTVNSPTYLTVELATAIDAPLQPFTLYIQTGSEEAVLPNGLQVQTFTCGPISSEVPGIGADGKVGAARAKLRRNKHPRGSVLPAC